MPVYSKLHAVVSTLCAMFYVHVHCRLELKGVCLDEVLQTALVPSAYRGGLGTRLVQTTFLGGSFSFSADITRTCALYVSAEV